MKLGIIKSNIYVDLMKNSKIFFIISTLLIITSILFIIFKGLNFGIDFKGGILLEFKSKESNINKIDFIKNNLTNLNIKDFSVKEFSNDFIQIIISLDSKVNTNNAITTIKNFMNKDYIYLQSQYIGPSVSEQLLYSSIISIIASFVGIFAYLWFRFDWQYGAIGVLTLLHDVVVSLFFLSVFNFEFNITTIAGLLTIIGYSINDTVVIFDQVRENTKKYIKKDINFILNSSISQVLSRSIATSITVLLVLLSIFILGGNVLKSFSFTLLVGVFFGTYSSICIALPLLKYIGNIKARILNANK